MWLKVRLAINSLIVMILSIIFIKVVSRGRCFDYVYYGAMIVLWAITMSLLIKKQKEMSKNQNEGINYD